MQPLLFPVEGPPPPVAVAAEAVVVVVAEGVEVGGAASGSRAEVV